MKPGRLDLSLLISCLLLTMPIYAAIDVYPFPNDELRQRYHALIDELRCPQCLNTNLAGSDAMIARDLRREVHRMVLEGKSDQEVLTYMFERYGDFILYNPPFRAGTLLLWLGPLAAFLIALIVGVRVARIRSVAALSKGEMARLDQLLASDRANRR